MKMKHTRPILFGILACTLFITTSCSGPARRVDRREDRRDYQENRRDEAFTRGPLDRAEDRMDRREDRWDRRGF